MGYLPLTWRTQKELSEAQVTVEKAVFDCALKVKKPLQSRTLPSSKSASDSTGVKLSKIDVPIFDGNILNWKTFWERFKVSVHDRTNISDTEKLVYLQHALKEGTAKRVIEGLSRSGEHYAEAVECLQARYDKPRLIHQTHVCIILEAPALKDGSGRELRCLHDTAQQHLRALKSLGHEPPGPFIASLLELKLDANTMFEWQRHSQTSTDVPHYNDLLEFDLRAQALESSTSEPHQKPVKNKSPHGRKNPLGKPVASFVASADIPVSNCVVCKRDKHPLYTCTKFNSEIQWVVFELHVSWAFRQGV